MDKSPESRIISLLIREAGLTVEQTFHDVVGRHQIEIHEKDDGAYGFEIAKHPSIKGHQSSFTYSGAVYPENGIYDQFTDFYEEMTK